MFQSRWCYGARVLLWLGLASLFRLQQEVRAESAQNSEVNAGFKVTFGGKTQACAGGLPDAVHSFVVDVKVQDAAPSPRSPLTLRFEIAPRRADGPRFVQPDGKLSDTLTCSVENGRAQLRLRSGVSVGDYRLLVWQGLYDANATLLGEIAPLGETILRVNSTELIRRFPWRWVGHTNPLDVTTDPSQWHDEGYLTAVPAGRDRRVIYKFYLKCRRDSRRGDLDGNWDAVNGHRLLIFITEARLVSNDRDKPDIVLTDPRAIARYWRIEGADKSDPTQLILPTRSDGSAQIVLRRVAKTLPRALAGRELDYSLGYRDESQEVDEPKAVNLSLRGQEPLPQTGSRSRIFAAPSGVKGVLAWTIADKVQPFSSSPSDPVKVALPPHDADAGLYIAHLGDKSSKGATTTPTPTPQRYPFRVQWRDFYSGADKITTEHLTFAPDGERLLFGSESETWGDDLHSITGVTLRELDLKTGQDRIVLGGKANRSDFQWSPDGRYLSFYSTFWTENPSAEGLDPFYLSGQWSLLDTASHAVSDWERSHSSPGVWTADNHLLWSEGYGAKPYVTPPKTPQQGYGRVLQGDAFGRSPSIWRDDAWDVQLSSDGRHKAFFGLPRLSPPRTSPAQAAKVGYFPQRNEGDLIVGPYGTVLWSQLSGASPLPLTRVEKPATLVWSRDGHLLVSVTTEEDDDNYWGQEAQCKVNVTVWNTVEGTIEESFTVEGRVIKKASGYPGAETISALGLSSDAKYLYIRYRESDPKTATPERAGSLAQGIFALDLATQRPSLLASFRDVDDLAWQTQ